MQLSNYNNCNYIRVDGDIVTALKTRTYGGKTLKDIKMITNSYLRTDENIGEEKTGVNTSLVFNNATKLFNHTGIELKTEPSNSFLCQINKVYEDIYDKQWINYNTGLKLRLAKTNLTGYQPRYCSSFISSGTTGYITDITLSINGTVMVLNNPQLGYSNHNIDNSAFIKTQIETQLTINGFTYSNVLVTYNLSTVGGVTHREYFITINSDYKILNGITTTERSYAWINEECGGSITFPHKRVKFNVPDIDLTGIVGFHWRVNNYDFTMLEDVLILSYPTTTVEVDMLFSNVNKDVLVFLDVYTKDGRKYILQWKYNPFTSNIIGTTSPIIIYNGSQSTILIKSDLDSTTVLETKLVDATVQSVSNEPDKDYLLINKAGFNLSVMKDGIYNVSFKLFFEDNTCVTITNNIFFDCIVKCEVVDCLAVEMNYELFTAYQSLVVMNSCINSYSSMRNMFDTLLSLLCVSSVSSYNDCGCN